MSYSSFPLLSGRHVATTLLSTSSFLLLLLAEAGPASATVTARLNGARGSSASQPARPPVRQAPQVLDAEEVRKGLQQRFKQSDAAHQRSLDARRIERPAPTIGPLPRSFDPDRWIRR